MESGESCGRCQTGEKRRRSIAMVEEVVGFKRGTAETDGQVRDGWAG